MNLKKGSLLGGTFIFTLGKFTNLAAGYIVIILLTRYLDPYMFGVYSLATAYLSFLYQLSAGGINNSLLYLLPKKDSSAVSTLITGLVFVLLLSLFSYLFLFFILFVTANDVPELSSYLKIMGLTIFINSLLVFLSAAVQSKQYYAASVIPQQILKPVFLLLFIFCGYLVVGSKDGFSSLLPLLYLCSMIIPLAVSIYFFYSLRKKGKFPSLRIHKGELRKHFDLEIIKVAPTFLTTSLVNQSTPAINMIFIGGLLSVTEVGFYNIATKMVMFLTVFLGAVTSVYAPLYSKFSGENNLLKLGEAYKRSTKMIVLLSAPIFIFAFMNAEPLMLVFGSEYISASSVFTIFIIGQIAHVVIGSSGNLLMMTGKHKENLVINSLSVIVGIVLSVVFIQFIGLLGAAIGQAISVVLMNVSKALMIRKSYKIHPYSSSFFRFLAVIPLTWFGSSFIGLFAAFEGLYFQLGFNFFVIILIYVPLIYILVDKNIIKTIKKVVLR